MRPNFKTIDITKAVASQPRPVEKGAEWMTAELIPVKKSVAKRS